MAENSEKEVLAQVLELYKDFPCLWDTSHKLYCNKDAREQALNILLEKYKVLNPRATTDALKKKLEHMRAAYRRERNKVESSKSSGSGLENVYTPSLWYYNYLTFLHERTNPISEGIDNASADSDSNSVEPATKKERNTIKKQQKNIIQKHQDLIESVKKLIDSSGEESSADTFGRSVSSQLKELPKLQRCFAEKLIGDVLFYAKLGELNSHTNITFNKTIYSRPESHLNSNQPRSFIPQYLRQPNYTTINSSPQHSSYSPQYVTLPPLSLSPSSQLPLSSPSPSYQFSSPSPQNPTPSPLHPSESYQCLSPSPQHPSPSPQHSSQSPQHPLQSTQHPLASPQHPLPSPQHPLQSTQHPLASPQHPLPSPQHPLQSTQHPLASPQHPLASPQHPLPSPQNSLPSPQHPSLSPHHPSSTQILTPSADLITIYSNDTQSQNLPFVQLIPSYNSFTPTNNDSGPLNTNNNLSEGIVRGKMEDMKQFLIFKK